MNDNPIDALDMAATDTGPNKSVLPANGVSATANGSALNCAEEARIDWDVQIDAPPPRPSEIVALRFVESGKRPIRIMDEPQD